MGGFTKMLVFTTIMVLSLHQMYAFRPLKEGPFWQQKLLIQSLQRGPVQRSQRNPCSTVPGRSRGRCTLAENDVVVHHAPPPPPPTLPQLVN
ncbi:hypothetical protein Fmac_024426 [Flemingia macrophylla]|uniref:Uncharacterized protein n=1 Tax=Flemingia macrophylla TaxID=520843 RepID=A0ABD1LPV9_9FABA